ncbi:flavin reductase family protein [Actinoalloteichus hymeniacidonis]|uniref:Conserved protein of DIM6/NTAB family n=1 Tax=Actinoalloteichus hymeniacidonis TaxID=340345 RepID=A0AAC9MXL2_9PSEU|nr:flavin reductase family protein [Actinoalloteichus hymeniacidonis]AOS62355.1 conserved protein of DIM6/NTAB family [Actinoalloteichus hymeniacidonis]MBB5909617.1 flavin reductase (DIM6/NTAB) family NADH-FMN oxidoreductase RutF [Actinoalloteichus hymeniacidonis]
MVTNDVATEIETDRDSSDVQPERGTDLDGPEPQDAADDVRFRLLMAGFPTGVTVISTLGRGQAPMGMTCSALCSVSLGPPTLLACLRAGSPTLAAIRRRRVFAVNLLHEAAQPVAELFGSGAPDRFDRVRWRIEPSWGVPVLFDDVHAVARCRVVDSKLVGDHRVVFGEVTHIRHYAEIRSPLMYGRRRYAGWPAG